MNQIWNEKYLNKGRLLKPKFLRDWKNGFKHLDYAFERRKFAFSVYALVLAGKSVLTYLGLFIPELLFQLLELFVLVCIVIPVILSAWADLKDSEVMVYETNLSKLSIKMFLVSIVFILLSGLLSLLLIVPGLWFATIFSFSIITMCVDNSSFFKCFYISKSLVKGSFFDVFIYLILWAILFVALFSVGFVFPLVYAMAHFGYAYSSISYGILTFIFGFTGFILQLSFFPPMVYMFAYLTDKKLHNK